MEQTQQPQKKAWYRRKIIVLVLVIIGLVVFSPIAFILFIVYIAQPVKVEGIAMAPILNNGDRIFISKRVGTIKRGDIIVFYYPEDTSKSFIKRVVGLPGELIELRDGQTLINGSPLDEPYVDRRLNQFSIDLEPVRIPEQNYFVMGDNRDASSDSRLWGTLPKSYIYGEVIGRYWPPG